MATLYQYNALGEAEFTATDMDRDGVIDFDADRIRRSAKSVESINGVNVVRTRTYAWATNNSSVSNLMSDARVSSDGLRTWNIIFSTTNRTHARYAGNGDRYMTNISPDGSYTISYSKDGQLKSVTRKDPSGNQLSQTTYAYDAHGRQVTVTDARNGTATYAFDNADRVVSMTTPPPGNGQSPQTTSYTHDFAGRLTRTVQPDGASVTNTYHRTGELATNYGARTYPVAYGYDAQGRRTNMTTWKDFAAGTGKAVTRWRYNARGFLTEKIYDDGKGTTNTYTPAGRLRTRVWARGITTTYHTNAAGEVYATTYSDGTAPVTNNFDRLGRKTNIIDGAGSRFLTYKESGQLLTETYSSGPLAGLSISNGYDSLLRRTALAFRTNTGAPILTHSYVYDGSSRLTNVNDVTYSATYSYLANSPLISQLTYRSNSATRMTTTKSYDYLNRLQSISSAPSASSVAMVAPASLCRIQPTSLRTFP